MKHKAHLTVMMIALSTDYHETPRHPRWLVPIVVQNLGIMLAGALLVVMQQRTRDVVWLFMAAIGLHLGSLAGLVVSIFRRNSRL